MFFIQSTALPVSKIVKILTFHKESNAFTKSKEKYQIYHFVTVGKDSVSWSYMRCRHVWIWF